jgi:hypothetical protein
MAEKIAMAMAEEVKATEKVLAVELHGRLQIGVMGEKTVMATAGVKATEKVLDVEHHPE